jgi:hypothetical protein
MLINAGPQAIELFIGVPCSDNSDCSHCIRWTNNASLTSESSPTTLPQLASDDESDAVSGGPPTAPGRFVLSHQCEQGSENVSRDGRRSRRAHPFPIPPPKRPSDGAHTRTVLETRRTSGDRLQGDPPKHEVEDCAPPSLKWRTCCRTMIDWLVHSSSCTILQPHPIFDESTKVSSPASR